MNFFNICLGKLYGLIRKMVLGAKRGGPGLLHIMNLDRQDHFILNHNFFIQNYQPLRLEYPGWVEFLSMKTTVAASVPKIYMYYKLLIINLVTSYCDYVAVVP